MSTEILVPGSTQRSPFKKFIYGAYKILKLFDSEMLWEIEAVNNIEETSVKILLKYFLKFCSAFLRGAGQVVFSNNLVSGIMIIIAYYIADVWVAINATVSLFVCTLTAMVFQVNEPQFQVGLFGYNGLLLGAGLATFIDARWSFKLPLFIAIYSPLCVFIQLALIYLLGSVFKIASFTLSFNISATLYLLASRVFQIFQLYDFLDPKLPIDFSNSNEIDFRDFIAGIFKGVSQVFLMNNLISSALILFGMLFCSRIAFLAAIIGSFLGCSIAYVCGADTNQIAMGLWGYNSTLCMICIGGFFYVLNIKGVILATYATFLSSILLATFFAFLSPFGLPALTWPFCTSALIFLLIQNSISGFVKVKILSTPDQHLISQRNYVQIETE
eukprot:TRINITY_DN312_c1_g1_i1.p1 TRINITY_DN312_c1_g1~~TRINITY_DN312_c1_g1_i1.p1  ORF type:complete len:386 (-),score=110.44 TRINITY_DN312_c1_g1_i1:41-1198(-)